MNARHVASRVLLLAFAGIPLVACESAKPAGPEPLVVEMQPFTVGPGEEVTKCQVVNVGNAEDFDFSKVSSSMTGGSHHLILYSDASYLAGQVPPPEGFGDCVMDTPRLFVYGAQEPEREASMPTGVAGQLRANTVAILEAHYANASSEAVEARVKVTFEPADPASIDHYAGVMMFADTEFSIPAGAGINGAPMYSHGATCGFPGDVNVFRIGSHAHKRLEKFEIFHHDMNAPADIAKIYENTDWHAPLEITYPDGAPMQVTSTQGFRFTCEWTNETAQAIEFGESVEDEMCLMGAGYYPRIENGPYGLGGVVFCADGTLYY